MNKDPSQAQQIYRSDGWTSFRNYIAGGRKVSNWLSLNADEYYYIEVQHTQYAGGDVLSVAVEINDPNIVPGHHHTMREVQRFEIRQTLTRE